VGATTADEGLGFLAYLRDPSHRGQNGDAVRSRAKGRQQRNMARTPFVAIASWGRERSVTRYEKRNKKIAVTSYPPRGRRRGLLGLPANEHGGVVCRASCVMRRVSNALPTPQRGTMGRNGERGPTRPQTARGSELTSAGDPNEGEPRGVPTPGERACTGVVTSAGVTRGHQEVTSGVTAGRGHSRYPLYSPSTRFENAKWYIANATTVHLLIMHKKSHSAY
jgi:hypothetical protein